MANGHQVLPTFPPPSLIIPYGGFSPVRLEASLVILRPSESVPGLVGRKTCSSSRFWLSVQASRTAAVPTGPWRGTVYHAHAYKRYYGLIRQSDTSVLPSGGQLNVLRLLTYSATVMNRQLNSQ